VSQSDPAGWPEPVVVTRGPSSRDLPLVVLLHGRGSHEGEIIGLADQLPEGNVYAAVRAPIYENGGFAWFANRGIGRPVPESLTATMAWFRGWLDPVAPTPRPVLLIGFSGGAAFAGGLLLSDPHRWTGTAVLYGTLPFDAGVPVTPGRLAGTHVLVAQGAADMVIPRELLDRTWRYLNEESGAEVSADRYSGGHGLTAPALDRLSRWVQERTSPG
jgi:phospholipase/carboxylesterase